jgi:hypothetical protein
VLVDAREEYLAAARASSREEPKGVTAKSWDRGNQPLPLHGHQQQELTKLVLVLSDYGTNPGVNWGTGPVSLLLHPVARAEEVTVPADRHNPLQD